MPRAVIVFALRTATHHEEFKMGRIPESEDLGNQPNGGIWPDDPFLGKTGEHPSWFR